VQKPHLVWFVNLLLGTPGLKSRCHRKSIFGKGECKYYELFIPLVSVTDSSVAPSLPQETPNGSEPRE
jgi:hypothetical protein